MKGLIPEHLQQVKPYKPGKPMEELERELGISGAIKLASNENPLGPSPMAMAAIREATGRLHRYPDDSAHMLINALAEKRELAPESVVLGNGSDDLIAMVTRAYLLPGDEAVIPTPTFLMYELAVRWCAATPVYVTLKGLDIDLYKVMEAVTDRTKIIFLCNPNNPTGGIVSKNDLKHFLTELPPGVVVVLDEAYGEFVQADDYPLSVGLIKEGASVIALRTFSKAYGLAGLRVGYGLMSPERAALLHRVRIPFNVSIPAQVAALAALKDTDHLERTIRMTHQGLMWLQSELTKMGLTFFPTQANFFLIDLKQSADELSNKMLRKGVIVRSMSAYGYPHFIRINAGLPKENERFISALGTVL